MNVRQTKIVIWLAAVTTALLGCGILAGAYALPVSITSKPSLTLITAKPGSAKTSSMDDLESDANSARIDLSKLLRLSSTDYRQPLYDPPPKPIIKPVAPKPPPKPSMTATLIGTVDEPGHSMAMFKLRDGSIKFIATGQSFADTGRPVTILTISLDHATVDYAGETLTLKVNPASSSSPKTSPRARSVRR